MTIMHMLRNLSVGILLPCLLAAPVFLTAQAPTDEELKALEQQIEKKEAEQAEAKKKAEAETKRKVEAERKQKEEEAAKAAEEQKKKLEEAQRVNLEKQLQEEETKRQEEETKRLAIEEQKRKDEEAAKSKVTIIFYRNQGYVASKGNAHVYHNKEDIGRLPNNTYFIYFSPPGTQNFMASVYDTNEVENTFEFKPGQTYYVSIHWGFSGGVLEIVPNADGRSALKGTTNTGNINPADVLSDYEKVEAH